MRTTTRVIVVIVAIIGATYCFLGAAMNASFSVAAGPEHLSRYRTYWYLWWAGVVACAIIAASQLFALLRGRASRNGAA